MTSIAANSPSSAVLTPVGLHPPSIALSSTLVAEKTLSTPAGRAAVAGWPQGAAASSLMSELSGTPEEMLDKLQRGLSLSNAMMAAEIVDGDKEAARVLLGSNRLRQLREAIQQRIADLKALKVFIQNLADGKSDGRVGCSPARWKMFAERNPAIAARYPGGIDEMVKTVRFQLKDGKLKSEPLGGIIGEMKTCDDGRIEAGFSADDLQAAIDRLTTDQQSVDSQKELLTTLLQQIVQRKQRIMTTRSNIDAANHTSLKTVASNTRG